MLIGVVHCTKEIKIAYYELQIVYNITKQLAYYLLHLFICLYVVFYLSVSTFFLSVCTFSFICLYLLYYLFLPSFLSISTSFSICLYVLFYPSVSTFFFIYLSHFLYYLPHFFYLKNNLSFLQPRLVSFF